LLQNDTLSTSLAHRY